MTTRDGSDEDKCLQMIAILGSNSRRDFTMQMGLIFLDSYRDEFDSDDSRIYEALKKYFKKNPSTIPGAEALREILEPSVHLIAQASLLVDHIFKTIASHGYCDPNGARKELGEFVWKYFKLNSAWSDFCQSLNNRDLPIVKAQMREIFIGMIKAKDSGIDLIDHVEKTYIQDTRVLESLSFSVKKIPSLGEPLDIFKPDSPPDY